MPDAWGNIQPNINVQSYGAIGNGVNDDSSAITNSILAANAAGGGTVYFPPGTYLTSLQTLFSSVHLLGAGMGVTRIKLKNAQNTDLFNGGTANVALINLFAAFGVGNVGGIHDFSIRDMTLDANKANQSGGPCWPLRFYGYAFLLSHVEFCNGYFGGCQIDWNGGDIQTGSEVEAFIDGCRFYDNFGFGLQMGGPHDSIITDFFSMHAANANIHIAPNAAGANISNAHTWGIAQGSNSPSWLIEAGKVTMHNCIAESSDTVNVAILSPDCTWHGYIYGSGASPGVGMQLGQQAGNTQFPGQVFSSGGLTTAKTAIRTFVDGKFALNSSAINFANENNNTIFATLSSTGNNFVGTPDITDIIRSNVFDSIGGSSVIATITGGTISTATIVSRVNPAGAITGVILQAGLVPGQQVTVNNKSAFSITMAASGTSHVADGVSDVIAALTARTFVWDSTDSLWYRTG